MYSSVVFSLFTEFCNCHHSKDRFIISVTSPQMKPLISSCAHPPVVMKGAVRTLGLPLVPLHPHSHIRCLAPSGCLLRVISAPGTVFGWALGTQWWIRPPCIGPAGTRAGPAPASALPERLYRPAVVPHSMCSQMRPCLQHRGAVREACARELGVLCK